MKRSQIRVNIRVVSGHLGHCWIDLGLFCPMPFVGVALNSGSIYVYVHTHMHWHRSSFSGEKGTPTLTFCSGDSMESSGGATIRSIGQNISTLFSICKFKVQRSSRQHNQIPLKNMRSGHGSVSLIRSGPDLIMEIYRIFLRTYLTVNQVHVYPICI